MTLFTLLCVCSELATRLLTYLFDIVITNTDSTLQFQ